MPHTHTPSSYFVPTLKQKQHIPKSMQSGFTGQNNLCLREMRYALPCSWINNNTAFIDLGGRDQPHWPLWPQLSAGSPRVGREKLLIGLHFLKGAKHELASSWRNAGTDLLILLSLSGWENWLSGGEGAVETEEQHFEFRTGHNHQASGTRWKHTLLSFTNAVLYG